MIGNGACLQFHLRLQTGFKAGQEQAARTSNRGRGGGGKLRRKAQTFLLQIVNDPRYQPPLSGFVCAEPPVSQNQFLSSAKADKTRQ